MKKTKVRLDAYRREYIRGSIADRNGTVLAKSETPGGKRIYQSPYAYSSLIGYYSPKYGTYGIESTLDDILSHSKSSEDDKRGADIKLTIDASLQEKAYDSIHNMNGSVVVLDAESGEILALASSNAFDANQLDEQWEEMNQTEGIFYPNAYRNPVTPGSVFKLIVSKEIVEAGIENEIVEDEGALLVNGQTISNYGGEANGPISYEQGLVYSSNVYFMDRALKLGGTALYETGKDFLLGEEIKLDFANIKSTFDLQDYSNNIIASTAFGQGNTQITPLHMAMVVQAIAADGVMQKPFLFLEGRDGKGNVILEGKTERLRKVMSNNVARKIQKAMVLAGEHYELDSVGNSQKIAAKTGTAERGDGYNNAWFVSYAPADHPKYVIVVNRLKTDQVGKSLAPIAENLYDDLLQR